MTTGRLSLPLPSAASLGRFLLPLLPAAAVLCRFSRPLFPAALLGLLSFPSLLLAQTLRETSSTRQFRGETRLAVAISYAGGTLRVEPAATGVLYAMRLTYDEDRFAPLIRFDAARPAVTLGIEPAQGGAIRIGRRSSIDQAASIVLGTQAETTLEVALGASEARLELGGIRLQRVALEAGASRAHLQFSEANPIRCSRADLKAGAGELYVSGLGYAQCTEVALSGGVGKVTLDFGGRWTGRMHVQAEMAMGELVLRLPRGTGVRLGLGRFLTSFAPAGLVRNNEGTIWTSPGYQERGTRLELDVEAAIGGVTVEWID